MQAIIYFRVSHEWGEWQNSSFAFTLPPDFDVVAKDRDDILTGTPEFNEAFDVWRANEEEQVLIEDEQLQLGDMHVEYTSN